MKEIKDFLKVF